MMRPFLAALAAVAVLALSAASLAAQEVQPQQRVRLVLVRQPAVEGHAPSQELRGRLLAIDDQALTVEVSPGASPVRVSRDVIHRAYVSRGLPSRAAGAAVGAVMGAVVFGLGIGDCRWSDCSREESHPSVAAAAVGAGVGGVTGALLRSERWRRVRLSPSAGGAPAPDASVALLALPAR